MWSFPPSNRVISFKWKGHHQWFNDALLIFPSLRGNWHSTFQDLWFDIDKSLYSSQVDKSVISLSVQCQPIRSRKKMILWRIQYTHLSNSHYARNTEKKFYTFERYCIENFVKTYKFLPSVRFESFFPYPAFIIKGKLLIRAAAPQPKRPRQA